MLLFGKIEISQNFEYLITVPGFAKLVETVFGIVGLALGAATYKDSLEAWKEELFRSITILAIIISILYLLAHLLSDDLVISKLNRIIDIIFHVVVGVSLILAGSLMISSAVEMQNSRCRYSTTVEYCDLFDMKIGAGIFGIFTGFIYFLTAFAVFKTKTL